MISSTTLVCNNAKLLITFIKLTCNIEIKRKVSWNRLQCESNYSWLANLKGPESLSWKIDINWELHWVVSCKTYSWEYRLSCIWIDIDYDICVNLEFLMKLYLVIQIPENTDWVVSRLILTIVFLWALNKIYDNNSIFSCASCVSYAFRCLPTYQPECCPVYRGTPICMTMSKGANKMLFSN